MSLTRGPAMTALMLVGCGEAVSTPAIVNRPVRVILGRADPAARETTFRNGTCAPTQKFSVLVDDPDATDTVRALWFIDPNERYAGGVPGNSGVPVMTGSTVREVRAPGAFLAQVAGLTDGRKHRIEVVVTDGEFVEDELVDPVTTEKKPFLRVMRPAVALNDGGPQQVEAFRDDYVWLVEVTPCP